MRKYSFSQQTINKWNTLSTYKGSAAFHTATGKHVFTFIRCITAHTQHNIFLFTFEFHTGMERFHTGKLHQFVREQVAILH